MKIARTSGSVLATTPSFLREGDRCRVRGRNGYIINGVCDTSAGKMAFDGTNPADINSSPFNASGDIVGDIYQSNYTGLTTGQIEGANAMAQQAGMIQSSGGVQSTGTGKGWDFANNALNFLSGVFGKGGSTTTTTPPPAPAPTSGGGMGTLAIVGIVAGVGLVGFLIYKAAK